MALDVDVLGCRIRAAREESGASLSALAQSAGIAKSYLLKLERGEVPNPGLATLSSVARALELTLGQLLAPPGRLEGQIRNAASEWELLSATIPPSLRQFLDEREKQGEPVQADMKIALAKARYRGKQPATEADWMFVMSAIQRSVGTES